MVEDEEKELIYIGARSSSVMDYAIGNIQAKRKIDSHRSNKQNRIICQFMLIYKSRT